MKRDLAFAWAESSILMAGLGFRTTLLRPASSMMISIADFYSRFLNIIVVSVQFRDLAVLLAHFSCYNKWEFD